jgi:tRNA-splicing ligase RtcB
MMAVKTGLGASDLPADLSGVRQAIEAAVPHGFGKDASHERGGWDHDHVPEDVLTMWNTGLKARYTEVQRKSPVIARRGNDAHHLGTLGSGNHFIEICLDEDDRVWIMLHSGSRGIGNRIGRYFIELAKDNMRKFGINLPDKDLAFLPEGTKHFDDYMEAVEWAQAFAKINREIMMNAVISSMCEVPGIVPHKAAELFSVVRCHHNFVAREHHYGKNVLVTRKGACRAREGDMVIIPGSMGTRSYIARGKGNEESFHSCSHGAGRRMSRRKARETFSLEDHAKATKGVECRKDNSVLDETPGAYKSIDAVMAAQEDLVEVVHTLKQIICVKG